MPRPTRGNSPPKMRRMNHGMEPAPDSAAQMTTEKMLVKRSQTMPKGRRPEDFPVRRRDHVMSSGPVVRLMLEASGRGKALTNEAAGAAGSWRLPLPCKEKEDPAHPQGQRMGVSHGRCGKGCGRVSMAPHRGQGTSPRGQIFL